MKIKRMAKGEKYIGVVGYLGDEIIATVTTKATYALVTDNGGLLYSKATSGAWTALSYNRRTDVVWIMNHLPGDARTIGQIER